MSEIKIFLASSSELEKDRRQFEIFINRRNKALRSQDIFLNLIIWEDFLDTVAKGGLQHEYNKAIENCDIFVVLVHNKIGKYTAEEFECAFGQFSTTSKPRILTYIKKPRTHEDREDIKSLWAFEDFLKKIKHYPVEYKNTDRLEKHFQDQLEKLTESGFFKDESESVRPRRESLMDKYRRPLQMQPLPEHFVERPGPQNALKEQLLCENDKGGTLVVSAIYGLGGIGKSVLASKLTHDAAVQDYFTDGILWVTLGQDPDILPLLSGWIQALGDYDYKPTAIESASNHLRTLLYGKCILLVVDDVWNSAHLKPFEVGGNKSRVMVTTRDARIAGARILKLPLMDEAQSLELMTQRLSEPLSAEARARALAFAKRVGHLPLALELGASQVEEGVMWQELLEDFEAEVARLETLDRDEYSQLPADKRQRHRSLVACFNLSLKQLASQQLQQFAWLGVVPEDVNLTQEMAATLWQVSTKQAGSILRTFRAKSLVLEGVKRASGRPSYRMHDLMHDLAKKLLQQPVESAREDVLPGLGLTVAAAHGELLDRYKEKAAVGPEGQAQWHTLKDDGYIFAHLTWHMEQAQRTEEIHGLLRTSDEAGRNGWYEVCSAIGKPAGFVNDVGRAWALAVESYEDMPGEALVLLYRYALIRGSLNSLASNIPAEIVGALVKQGIWQPAQGLAYGQQAKEPWRRVECVSTVVLHIPEGLLPEVLKTLGEIKEASYRSYGLFQAAKRFPDIWPSVLAAIREIQDRYGKHRYQTPGFPHKGSALEEIVQYLPSQYLPEAVEISQTIRDVSDRARSLAALAIRQIDLWPQVLSLRQEVRGEYTQLTILSSAAQHLPELWIEVLSIMRGLQHEEPQFDVIATAVKHLPDEVLPEVLRIARDTDEDDISLWLLSAIAQRSSALWPEILLKMRNLQNDEAQSYVIAEMVEYLPDKLLSEALSIARNMNDEIESLGALSNLARRVPELWPEVLSKMRALQNEETRPKTMVAVANIIAAMVQFLPHQLLPEALSVSRDMVDDEAKSWALGAIAKHLPSGLLLETLRDLQQIKDSPFQLKALVTAAPYVSNIWPEILSMTPELESHFSQSNTLKLIAQLIPVEFFPEVLSVLQALQDDSCRAEILVEMAKRLPDLWSEALSVVRAMNNSSFQAKALGEIASCLPVERRTEALSIIRDIKAHRYRSDALVEIAKYQPELWPEVLSIVQKVKEQFHHVEALVQAAKHQPELWPEIISTARGLQDKAHRSDALVEIAKYRPELWPEILLLVQDIEHEPSRSHRLLLMAYRSPASLFQKVLSAIKIIKDESSRLRALSVMARRQPELWPDVISDVRKMESKSSQASQLTTIAKHCPELWTEALSAMQEIKDEFAGSYEFTIAAPDFPVELWPEALSIIKDIKDESSRTRILISIVRFLPAEHWSEMLLAIQSVKDELSQSFIFLAMSNFLPDEQLPQALEIIWEIQDKYYRAQALQALLPALGRLSIPFPEWEATLDILAYQNRSAVLEALPDSRSIVTRIGDSETSQPFSNLSEKFANNGRSKLITARDRSK